MKKKYSFLPKILRYRLELIVFLAVFSLHFIAAIVTEPLIQYIGGDEVGTIASAAYFAGYDWSETMSMHKYYGFGYSLLMAPLFMIFDNVTIIYGGMLVCNGILSAASSVIAVRCGLCIKVTLKTILPL